MHMLWADVIDVDTNEGLKARKGHTLYFQDACTPGHNFLDRIKLGAAVIVIQ